MCNYTHGWEIGTVMKLWYREPDWPAGRYAPYQIKLDRGNWICAPGDSDNCVRGAAGHEDEESAMDLGSDDEMEL